MTGRGSRTFAVLLIAVHLPLAALSVTDEEFCASLDEAEDREAWEELLDAMLVLETGTRDEKLALFEIDEDGDVDGPFDHDWLEYGCHGAAVEELIDRLRSWAEAERDTWVLFVASGDLAFWGFENTLPLMKDLARHPAPSVRRRAIEYWSDWDGADELAYRWLIKMWKRERVPWLRAELLDAIYYLQDEQEAVGPPYDESVDLIRHPDPELAKAAIEFSASFELPGTEQALIDVVDWGSGELRFVALQELAALSEIDSSTALRLEQLWDRSRGWPVEERRAIFGLLLETDTSNALLWARQALADPASELGVIALDRVAQSQDPADRALLVRIARDGAPSLRERAIAAVAPFHAIIPDVEPLLLAALDDGGASVRLAAIEAVHDAIVEVPGNLQHFGGEAELPDWTIPESLAAVMLSVRRLERDDPVPEIRERIALLRETPLVALERTLCTRTVSWERVRVSGPAGIASFRCYAAPEMERPLSSPLRVPSGVEGRRLARFDDGRGTWWSLELDLDDGIDDPCWAPEAWITPRGPDEEPSTIATAHSELDLPRAETGGEVFGALERAGLLETFDPGERFVGVRLDAEALEAADRSGLGDALALTRGTLGEALREARARR